MFHTAKEWRRIGTADHKIGLEVPRYPDNEAYMIGYTTGEPVRLYRRVYKQNPTPNSKVCD